MEGGGRRKRCPGKDMIEQDSIRLLRECDAGAKMGVASLKDVIGYVHDTRLKQLLQDSRDEHSALSGELQQRLARFGDEGMDPNPIAKTMAEVKTGVKLAFQPSDQTVAALMTDGCNMGIKSLNQYLNEYAAAEEYAKDLAKRLIQMERTLADNLQEYL